jgi:hypothetical protein
MDAKVIRNIVIVGLEIALTVYYGTDTPAWFRKKFGKK